MQKVIPKAINTIPVRIFMFYFFTLFVLMSLYSWDSIGKTGSPFVNIFTVLDLPYAADILNLIVISAAISAINSDIFGAGRMMYGMAKEGLAPRSFLHVSNNGVPRLTVAVMIAALLCGVLLNYLIPDQVFLLIATIAAFATIWVWLMILLSHLAMRRAMPAEEAKKLQFPVPLWPVASVFATLFLLFVLGIMGYFAESQNALIVGVVWVLLLVVSYYIWVKKKPEQNEQIDSPSISS